jgi:hypothetical protein
MDAGMLTLGNVVAVALLVWCFWPRSRKPPAPALDRPERQDPPCTGNEAVEGE